MVCRWVLVVCYQQLAAEDAAPCTPAWRTCRHAPTADWLCLGLVQDAGGAAGDADFDDDFMIVAPTHSRQGAYGASQQPAASMMGTPAASFRATQLGPGPAAGPAAAGPAAGPGPVSSSGPAVIVGGGLAAFSGAAAVGLGSLSAVFSPALLPQHGLGSHAAGAAGSASCQPGFAVGGLGEGLSGLGGAEGAGLRVFAALSPAYGDTAQALMRLWKHMAGLTGWAPPDALLQAVVEAATTAVCAGELGLWVAAPHPSAC